MKRIAILWKEAMGLYPVGPTSKGGSGGQNQCLLQEWNFEDHPAKIRRGQKERGQDQGGISGHLQLSL